VQKHNICCNNNSNIIIKFQNKINEIFNMVKKYLGDNDLAVRGRVNKILLLNSSLY